ncbi:MAG: phytoene desaturase [Phycisphaerales bacterium]|nr:MAG: phytoene desaturase [Phycisphaerales bacterium]
MSARRSGHPEGTIGASRHASSDGRVVVIGGGLAGLAATVELASNGYAVTLVEKNEHLGGKMNVLSEKGFSFDMGPTILTLPHVIAGIIERTGRNVADYLDLINLDPQWRCLFEDQTVIDLHQDPMVMADAMDQQFPAAKPGSGYRDFIEYSRRMYRLSERVFFYRDLGSAMDMMRQTSPNDFGLLRDVMAMRMHSTMAKTVHRSVKEPHLQQLCEHFLQYVGSSPFLAPAILSLIAAAQTDHGCCYAMGGTRMVARTLENIARELDVEILTGVGVQRIIHDNHRATAVELEDGRIIPARSVVSNCDVQRTNRDLIGSAKSSQEQRAIASQYTPACSGVVLYLGLDRQYDHLAHHNFLFSEDSEREFNDIYHRGVPAPDPTIYLAVPSRTDPDQAPEGGEALYALIHTPYRRPGQNWDGADGLFAQYRPTVIDKLKRFGMDDIESHLVVERHLTPDDIDRMYNAEGGAIYGLASHGKLRGGFKPRNRSRVLKNLYLAGGSVNPGPGVPMVLMSGVTAANALREDHGETVPPIVPKNPQMRTHRSVHQPSQESACLESAAAS